jgi:hypothetical protein
MTEILSSIEAVVTRAEDTWDALESSELATVIPVAGHIVKIWRAAHTVRDALFAAKLLSFIRDPSLQTREARERMRERAESDEGKRIGEALFLILERMNDMLKPAWLARCYAGYLAHQITATDLRRLASAIDIAVGDDLLALLTAPTPEANDPDAPWKRYLLQSGLTDSSQAAIGGKRTFHMTALGLLFHKTVRAHSPPGELPPVQWGQQVVQEAAR